MAVDRTPILKRCRSLDMDPVVLGVNKKSRRKLTRANRAYARSYRTKPYDPS